MTEEPKKYSKPKIICPFCQERQPNGKFRAFAVNGISMHIRQIHPERYDEYQTHRDQYIQKFACDAEGNLTGSDPKSEPESIPESVVEQEVISEQTYVELEEPAPPPAPKVTQPPVEIPKKTPQPDTPKKEEFPDDKEPERYEYNPYGY